MNQLCQGQASMSVGGSSVPGPAPCHMAWLCRSNKQVFWGQGSGWEGAGAGLPRPILEAARPVTVSMRTAIPAGMCDGQTV